MFNTLKKSMSFFLITTIVSSFSFGTIAQAANDDAANFKLSVPETSIAYVGDVAFAYSTNNSMKAIKSAAKMNSEDLDVYYIQVTGLGNNKTYSYYNFTNEVAIKNPMHVYKTGDTQPEWDKLKYFYDAKGNFNKYTGVNVKYSKDTTVVVRDEFSSFVKVDGNTFSIPSGLTLSDLKKMLKATDGTTQTYEISGLTDTSELVAGTTYDLSVTAEDKTTKDSTTYKISVNAGGGGEIDLTIEQLKSVLKTQIAGAEALLSTVPDEKKTELEKAIKTAKDFYNTITDNTTVQQITDAIAALADAVTEAFNKESYFDVTYTFDNNMGTVQAVYKDTFTAIPSGSKVAKDSQVTFTATPKDNTIEVKSWTVNGTTETVKNTSKDVTVAGNTNVSVKFGSKSDVDEFTVTFDDKYSVGSNVYATVTSAVYTGNDFELINSGDKVAAGAKIRFSVNVNDDNYAFTNWNITNNGVDSTDSNKTTNEITVNGNVTAKANFKDASSGTEKTKVSVSFENNSVSSTVYNGTVSNTTYNVYAQLSATQVDFNISNSKASVEFAIGAKVESSDASADQLSKLISNLSFAINSDSTNYVESAKIENGKLVVVLKTDKIESDNISTITLNTSFNNSTAGTTNLKFKVTLK